MDLKLITAEPTTEERVAVDALLGATDARSSHVGFSARELGIGRHMLLPALEAVQARVGWISEGALGYVCERLDVPPADAWGVATFYALLATTPRPRKVLHVCDDIACRVRGAKAMIEALEHETSSVKHGPEGDHVVVDRDSTAWMHSPCLGMCDMAPAALMIEAGEMPVEYSLGGVTLESLRALLRAGADSSHSLGMTDSNPPIPQQGDASLSLLKRAGVVDPSSLEAYRAAGGYKALARARALGADGVIAEVSAAKLVGRGGAAFPTARKWESVRQQGIAPRYLVCNADESEPGTFKDRLLMTHDPFAVIESMTIAGFATGCTKGFIYLRAEYPLAFERLSHAIVAAREAGLLGREFDIEIRRGAGAYICGEETAIFESIEGKRGEPRNKPPFPAQFGLFGKPTVVNNVETLVNVLPILLNGGAAYARMGTPQSTGTRLFCLSGAVAKPGVYEVPCGTTLRALFELAGGVPDRLAAVLLGGAAGNFIRADEIDLPLTMEDTRAAGVTLGSGVVMAFDDSADMHDIVRRIAAFFRDESCGQCVPCRVGTVRQEESLHRIAAGKTIGGVGRELALLEEIGAGMKDGSICGLGQTAYSAVESAVKRLGLYGAATPAPSETIDAPAPRYMS
ncbi:MAG: NAD(P)H-dependent oxidoreductase subunit E [Gemmatimonadaceae bacterium]